MACFPFLDCSTFFTRRAMSTRQASGVRHVPTPVFGMGEAVLPNSQSKKEKYYTFYQKNRNVPLEAKVDSNVIAFERHERRCSFHDEVQYFYRFLFHANTNRHSYTTHPISEEGILREKRTGAPSIKPYMLRSASCATWWRYSLTGTCSFRKSSG
jgi:hypothetical protein